VIMAAYLLDTSVLIDLLRQKGEAADFIAKHPQDIFMTSCICQMEIFLGLYLGKPEILQSKKEEAQKLLSSLYEVKSFDSEQAEIASQIKTKLMKKGELIDDLDILIAACSISYRATILTKNAKHFSRVLGLLLKEF